VRFLLNLRNGQRPDVAVFYGGFNDVWTALFIGVGQHQNVAGMKNRLEAGPWTRAFRGFREGIFRDYLTLYYARRLVGAAPETAEQSWRRLEGAGPDAVAAAVDMYLENARIAREAGNAYGIRVYSYWQPNIADKKPLTSAEAPHAAAFGQELARLFQAATARFLERGGASGVVDRHALFQGDARSVFVDFAHLSGAGNLTVAEALARDALSAAQKAP
jgi:hypothetical protein